MKAWMVDDNNAEYGTSIVFAETRGKAISYALMWIDTFEDCSWTDIRAKRFPEYDQFYDGRSEADFWNDEDHRVRLVRDFGWSCFDPIDSYCEDCPAKGWCEHWKNKEKPLSWKKVSK